MKLSELVAGTKVDIKKNIVSAGNTEMVSYTSSVFDVTPEDEIVINMPSAGGKMVVLTSGLTYDFVFTMSAGIFTARGIVVRRAKQGQFYLLVIKLSGPLTKLQRREYYRMECMMPLVYQSIEAGTSEKGSVAEVRRAMMLEMSEIRYKGMGTILDISGGGIRFQCTDELVGISHLLISFQIVVANKKQQVDIVAKILHSEFKDQAQRFEYRCEFVYKDGVNRDTIIKYIFDEERRVRGIR